MHHFTGSKDRMVVRANKAGEARESRAERGRFPGLPGGGVGGLRSRKPHLPPVGTVVQDKHCLQIQFNEPGRQF